LFRYVIPGILGLLILLPYIDLFIPNWFIYSSTERIAFAIFFVLFLGLIIEIVVDLGARPVVEWCCGRSLFRTIFFICKDEPAFSETPKRRSVVPAELLLKMKVEDRELIWHTTAITHMFVGTAIVFFLSIVINSVNVLLFITRHGLVLLESNYSTGALAMLGFSFPVLWASLKLAMKYAQLRHDYVQVLIKKGT
jgi:hypothetical protein